MKKFLKVIAILFALLVMVFIGLAVYISSIDADKYRPQLITTLSQKTGRAVKLDGPIAFSLGFGGVKIAIQDASIANPSWASRPVMAGMGKFEVEVGLLPLLMRELSIEELSIENADILLETNAASQHNWDFAATGGAAPAVAKPTVAAPASGGAPGESLSIGKLSIINSQLAMRGADGKVSSYNVASLTITPGSLGGAELKFKGDANGTPIVIDAKTGITDLLSRSAFPFELDATYNNAIHLTAKGNADEGASKASVSSYEVTAGKSAIKGNVNAAWGGPRPAINGTLNADTLNPADFKTGGDAASDATPAKETKSGGKSDGRMFSGVPLPLDALKSVDANLNIAVGTFPLGRGALTQITAQLALSNGDLSLAPMRADVGSTPVNMQLKLNASQSPAHLTVGVIADGVDLGDLQKLADMSPFMTGKAGANIQLTGDGDSEHAIASSLGGVITITAEKGEILTGAAAGISSALGAIFNPQGGDAALNCLAARFTAKGGVLNDNGILIDSTPSTVAGKGNINLGTETVSLVLRAKTKLVDVGGLVPALQVSGPLSDPHYSVDAAAVVNNVISSLANGNIDVIASSVPDIQATPAGQNACVYTLDHPRAASSSSVLPSNPVGKASQKINSLVKGLFGQ